jgi:hypothetical protein
MQYYRLMKHVCTQILLGMWIFCFEKFDLKVTIKTLLEKMDKITWFILVCWDIIGKGSNRWYLPILVIRYWKTKYTFCSWCKIINCYICKHLLTLNNSKLLIRPSTHIWHKTWTLISLIGFPMLFVISQCQYSHNVHSPLELSWILFFLKNN